MALADGVGEGVGEGAGVASALNILKTFICALTPIPEAAKITADNRKAIIVIPGLKLEIFILNGGPVRFVPVVFAEYPSVQSFHCGH